MTRILSAIGATLIATTTVAMAQNCTSTVLGNTIYTNCQERSGSGSGTKPMPNVNFNWLGDIGRRAREERERDALARERAKR